MFSVCVQVHSKNYYSDLKIKYNTGLNWLHQGSNDAFE